MQKINFFFHNINYSLRERKKLKKTVESIFKKEKKALQKLNYIFCSDDYLLDINIKYLRHEYYTDIITFDLSSGKNKVEGEIYISLERVKENAKAIKTPLREELNRVIFHGALHLCGYSDKTKKEKSIMRKAEDNYLKRLSK